MQRQITQEQVLDAAAESLKASLYIRWGGNVTAYYPDSMTADIQPNPSDMRTDPDTGARYPEPWPILKNVRIAWPRFGGFVLVGPLKVNDPVTLEAFDLDPTTWMAQGEGRSTNPVAPADVRRLSGSYWSATPTDLTGPIKDASAAAAAFLLGLDGDTAQILFSAASLIVGKAGASVALSGGGNGVGRVGDAVSVTLTSAQIATISCAAVPGPCAGGPITLTGTITEGSSKVAAGG